MEAAAWRYCRYSAAALGYSGEIMGRIVCHFSCGAASAVATKLTIAKYGRERVTIYNAFIAEEHADNRRFAADCERWFGVPVTVLRDTQWDASVREVWRRTRYIKGPYGATCSSRLKHEAIDRLSRPDDVHVLGYTADAEDVRRARRFLQTAAECPLIDRGLTKADCLAIVERAGIELPLMYRLGYTNANCIGCCKGGKGYWNAIRRDFPADFAECAAIEAELGEAAYLFYDPATGKRFPLTQLEATAGRRDEVLPDCSFFCAMAEEEIASA